MRNNEATTQMSPLPSLAEKGVHHKPDFKSSAKTTGEVGMEPRVTELETHLKYIRRDMDEVRNDVKAIKHRLAYAAGAAAVAMGLLGWVANSRFDQLVTLLAH